MPHAELQTLGVAHYDATVEVQISVLRSQKQLVIAVRVGLGALNFPCLGLSGELGVEVGETMTLGKTLRSTWEVRRTVRQHLHSVLCTRRNV